MLKQIKRLQKEKKALIKKFGKRKGNKIKINSNYAKGRIDYLNNSIIKCVRLMG